jgi:hypothetical protein
MKRILDFLLWPWHKWQEKKRFKKRLAELRKRDPFIYK